LLGNRPRFNPEVKYLKSRTSPQICNVTISVPIVATIIPREIKKYLD
jgi:hypothetical protein